MHFDLSPEICDLIIFGMENQNQEQLFDTKTLTLIGEDEALSLSVSDSGQVGQEFEPFEERFLALPSWRSADGYNLMESFVGTVHNPLQKELLRQILQSGRGVFRQFKDALKEDPPTESQWFRFKQKEMRRRVQEWYNDLREFWGLEPKNFESDANFEDMLLSDFVIQAIPRQNSAELQAWDRQLFTEAYAGRPDWEIDYLYAQQRLGQPLPAENSRSPAFGAFSPSGELSGFIWLIESEIKGKMATYIVAKVAQIGVLPDFRGLGMASALINHVIKQGLERRYARLFFEVVATPGYVGQHLEKIGWQVQAQSWRYDLSQETGD